MRRFWRAYQLWLQRCSRCCSPTLLKISALLLFSCTAILFMLPQRSEWLLAPLLLLLWCLMLLLARQMFINPPDSSRPVGLLAQCRYWLRLGWYQLMLLLFLVLCLICLAFSLKLSGVILRALLA
jgi:hypothetical protein